MLLCAATLGAMAQEARKFTINGHLTDVDSKGAMEHVSIQLFWAADSAFVGGTAQVVALNFYDLLRQQSNYERWVSATGRSDTRYNSINSYAMLHVRYRLNMFGGKVDTEGRYDKKWGNRDRR